MLSLCKKYDILPNLAFNGKRAVAGSIIKTEKPDVYKFSGTILFESDDEYEKAYEWLRILEKEFQNEYITIESIEPNKDFWGS